MSNLNIKILLQNNNSIIADKISINTMLLELYNNNIHHNHTKPEKIIINFYDSQMNIKEKPIKSILINGNEYKYISLSLLTKILYLS